MPTQILAVGSTAQDSGDLVVSVGTPVTVCLKAASGQALDPASKVFISLKDDVGQYAPVDALVATTRPALMIAAPGTYRFSRPAGPSCGVFSG